MAEWKRAGGFGGKGGFGGGKKGGFQKKSFGAPRFGGGFKKDAGRRSFGSRDEGGEREMFDAVCSNCGSDCQVPFKPNGKTPVLCKTCFAKSREEEGGGERRSFGGDRGDRGGFGARRDGPGGFGEKKQFDTRTSFKGERSYMPRTDTPPDPRIGGLEKGLVEVNQKLDRLIDLLSGVTLESAVRKVSKKPTKKKAVADEETF
jgi:CxxC-x17-CxxC domain-containing protein